MPHSEDLTERARLALWMVAGGVAKRLVAQRVGLSYGYLRALAASPEGREYMQRVEDEARREIGTALALAS